MERMGLALKSFFSILKNKERAERIENILSGAPSEGVQLLAILQRDGRLLDFFQEDISQYSDAQIGAAVRTVHEGCRKALQEVLPIEYICHEEEGDTVTLDKDFDPSAFRLTGHVFGDPPFTGILKHHGWKVSEIKFPKIPKGSSSIVIAPAEVEISRPQDEE